MKMFCVWRIIRCYFAFLSIDIFVFFTRYSLRYWSLKLYISSIEFLLLYKVYTPYANMADHSVVAWNELYESEASWASVFCFDNASSEKSCFVRHLVFFISLRLRVFMFLNATRRDRNCPASASKGKKWIHAIH